MQVDLFSYDKVMVPIHLSVHWTCAVLDLREKRLIYYDSLGSAGQHHLEVSASSSDLPEIWVAPSQINFRPMRAVAQSEDVLLFHLPS